MDNFARDLTGNMIVIPVFWTQIGQTGVKGRNQSHPFLQSCVLGLSHAAICSVLPVPMFCFVDNLDDCEEKKRALGSLEKVCCVQFNGEKRAVDFLWGPAKLIKRHISSIRCEFLICDTHMQLFW